jgi:hypothetical protein
LTDNIVTPIFSSDGTHFTPDEMALGPFGAIQGGALAGLMAHVAETLVPAEFVPVSVHTQFLRATPLGELDVSAQLVQRGQRLAFVEATIQTSKGTTARANFVFGRPIEIAAILTPESESQDPLAFERRVVKSPHGRAWLMDALDGRIQTDGTVWFRWLRPLVAGASRLTQMLGPVDWTHGIARPGFPGPAPISAWPNLDLTVHLHRTLQGKWVAIRPRGTWEPNGFGLGWGEVLDDTGPVGRVTMAVALIP